MQVPHIVLLVVSLKAVVEIALLAGVGRFILGLLAGQKKEQNPFWQMLDIMVRPLHRVVRVITPAAVLDSHIPVATNTLLITSWLFLTLMKIEMCVKSAPGVCG